MVNQQQIEASLRPRLEDLETQRVQLVQQVFLTGFLCLVTTVLTIGICYSLFSSGSHDKRKYIKIGYLLVRLSKYTYVIRHTILFFIVLASSC